MRTADILPAGWRGVFSPQGRVGIGMDLATTNKARSNPSALAVCQEVGLDVFARLLVRYGAAELARRLRGTVPVALIVASASIEYRGQKMKCKEYQTNLYLHQIDDGRLALPDEQWVEDDARQVKTERGFFYAEVDEEGNHADAFDATKQALHALQMHGAGAPAELTPAGAAGFARPRSDAGVWRQHLPEDVGGALPI
jgi:hypothetical protein